MTNRSGSQQEQFLQVLSRDEAYERFLAALNPQPLGLETLPLHLALGRVLGARVVAQTIRRPLIVPVSMALPCEQLILLWPMRGIPSRFVSTTRFSPAVVRPASRCARYGDTHCHRCAAAARSGCRHDDRGFGRIRRWCPLHQGGASGQHVAFAGSDIARGQVLLEPGVALTARELAMIAAIGQAEVPVWRRPRIAVLSTGDELVPPGGTLGPAQIYDSNGAAIAATLAEAGCEPVPYGIVTDDPELLRAALKRAHANAMP